MRYSEVLSGFYKIGLSNAHQHEADVFFSGAGHHWCRMHEAPKHSKESSFHLSYHRAHLRMMMLVIYQQGDFSLAEDPSGNDLNVREMWNPDSNIIPDPAMFDSFGPDEHAELGQPYRADIYLEDANVSRSLIIRFEKKAVA